MVIHLYPSLVITGVFGLLATRGEISCFIPQCCPDHQSADFGFVVGFPTEREVHLDHFVDFPPLELEVISGDDFA